MADPISLTTSVITLATVLKDVVELAQNIRESFKKPARNKRAVQALAEETLDIVIGISDFYEIHKEKLENAFEMQDTILNLLIAMNAVYNECGPILQLHASPDRKLRTRIKQKIIAWWNRDDVEEKIRNLRDIANRCDRQFMRYGIMRIETDTAQIAQIQATTATIQNTTLQIRNAVADGFTRTHGRTSPLQVSDQNTLAFLGSSPVILSTLPVHVQLSKQLIYGSYITTQIGKIGTFLQVFSSHGSYPVEGSDSLHLRPFRPVILLKPSNVEEIEDVQSNIFSLIVKIQESLKSGHQCSMQLVAWGMSNLSVGLSNLGMDRESFTIAQFAVDLYTSLSKTNECVYGPHLAHALSLISHRYSDAGDIIEAYKAITKAVTLGRRLADADPTFEAQIQLAKLLTYSASIGRQNRDRTNALKNAQESVQCYQRLIGNPKSILRAEVEVTEGLEMTLERTYVRDFANALEQLHYNLSSARKNRSVKVGVEALELYRCLEKVHRIGAFSDEIACLCSSLASHNFWDIVPVNQALLYARESVQHYEKILQNTGVIPHNLPHALGLEVKLLSRLERFDEGHGVCQKLARIIQTHIDNQEFRAQSFLQLIENLFISKCYAEAALRVENLFSMHQSFLSDQYIFKVYTYTLSAFDEMGDNSKSIQIAEASATHWRMLTLQKKDYLKYVARSILSLTRRYLWAKDYERALNKGEETMKLYRGLITEDNSLLKDYITALWLNIDIAKEAKTLGLECVERSRLVVQYSRALVDQFSSQQLFLVRIIRDHSKLLENYDHLADAGVAISEVFKWFDAHSAQSLRLSTLHIDCLIHFARFLRLQGHPEHALSLYNKAMTIGQHFLHAYSIALNILRAKAYNLSALYVMGQISIALDEIDGYLIFASEHNLQESAAYTYCLNIVSRLYRCNGRVDDALIIIDRSIALDREDTETRSYQILSDLLADAGKDEEALIIAHKAIRETEKWMDPSSPLGKECHVQAQYTLALRLFASGQLTEGREWLAQVRLFYQRHSKARNIWFIDLAITLWAIGHLECASGRHEEGIAARTQLNELRKRLRIVFPSLDNFVEVGLNREKNFAAWQRLLEKYTLSCGHQDEEISKDNTDPSGSQGSTPVASPDHVLATS